MLVLMVYIAIVFAVGFALFVIGYVIYDTIRLLKMKDK